MQSIQCQFFAFLLEISLFKMIPKHSANMLYGVPKHKKAVMCLKEKIYAFNMLHSDMSYSTIGCEFNANKSIIYIKQGVFKQKHIKQGYILVD